MTEFPSGLKLTEVKSGQGTPWLFFPGGPGMGSQSLHDLIEKLNIDASLYRVDLPDDGDNRLGLPISLERWQKACLECVLGFDKVVLIGHSFGGMLLQTIPELETQTKAVVLANTAPDNFWFESFSKRAIFHRLPNVSELRKGLLAHPSDKHYKSYMLNSSSYYFTPQGLLEGIKLFHKLPFNHLPYLWALDNFHPTYKASWLPEKPCLILSASHDYMTPQECYSSKIYQRANIEQVCVERAGHFPWIEQPTQTIEALERFAAGL